jgi:hypothetical protein
MRACSGLSVASLGGVLVLCWAASLFSIIIKSVCIYKKVCAESEEQCE